MEEDWCEIQSPKPACKLVACIPEVNGLYWIAGTECTATATTATSPKTTHLTLIEKTLGGNTKDPTTCWNSERIGVEKLGQRPKMSSNGEPLGAELHCIYTTIHEGYAWPSTRLHTVQSYVSDVMVELRLCRMTSREAACTARGAGLDLVDEIWLYTKIR